MRHCWEVTRWTQMECQANKQQGKWRVMYFNPWGQQRNTHKHALSWLTGVELLWSVPVEADGDVAEQLRWAGKPHPAGGNRAPGHLEDGLRRGPERAVQCGAAAWRGLLAQAGLGEEASVQNRLPGSVFKFEPSEPPGALLDKYLLSHVKLSQLCLRRKHKRMWDTETVTHEFSILTLVGTWKRFENKISNEQGKIKS